MTFRKARPRFMYVGFAVMLAVMSACAPASAFKQIEFAWPIAGSAQLTISGNTYDITFAETTNFMAKTDFSLNLNLGKWRHNLTMTYVMKNGNLPPNDLLKIGELGIFLDRWRLISSYDKLTITAGDTAVPNVFTKYMSGSSLYGATLQSGGALPGVLKDTTYTISGMGGKNSSGRGISSTTMDVAGLALELQYLKALKFNIVYAEGLRTGTDIKIGSAMIAYSFDTNSLTLDGAVSSEAFTDSVGWFSSLTYSGNFQKKVGLSTNLTYTSGEFTRIGGSTPSTGGVISTSAGLTLNLTPPWKGSETMGFKAKFSKDNIEMTATSSLQSFEASVTYSASGFAPSTSASVTYSFETVANDLLPQTVDSVKHSLDLKYSYQTAINSSRFSFSIAAAPTVLFNNATDDISFSMTNGMSASIYSGQTSITGKAGLKVGTNKQSSLMTLAPSLELTASTNFSKPAISMAATLKLSNSSSLKYDLGTITNDVSYLDISPNITWKISDSFSMYARYAGKLRFGASVTIPTWTDTFSTGISFKL